MEPDLVWLVRPGANEELRYSMRSVLANLPHGRVWVIGQPPDWCTAPTIRPRHVRVDKHKSTSLAMRVACKDPRISDPFIYLNDDFFLREPVGVLEVLDLGPLRARVDHFNATGNASRWAIGHRETLAVLVAAGYDEPKCFEAHVPLVIHKAAMLQALDLAKGCGARTPHKRTIYATLARLESRTVKDPKVLSADAPMPEGPWVSTSDKTFTGAVGAAIRAAFPDPSPFERE